MMAASAQPGSKIRVLVIDDSAAMRGLITATLRRNPWIEVVGGACDPFQAREAIKQLAPDVVTLDVEMPGMSGLVFLERLMRLRPTPVVMVSSLTGAGAETSIRALEIGAVDCVSKPSPEFPNSLDELASKVVVAATARIRMAGALGQERKLAPQPHDYVPDASVVAIGSSTGGVEALIEVLSQFPQNCPPTVITQHMPALFTKSLALRLDRLCPPRVEEAYDGAALKSGHVYLAPGGPAHLEVTRGPPYRCRLREGDLVNGHRPSVDVMFASLAKAAGRRAVGVILTGMGRDGAQGMLAMRGVGAHTIGQDEASSIVYGMPKSAYELGAVAHQLPLSSIAAEILAATNSANNSWRTECHTHSIST